MKPLLIAPNPYNDESLIGYIARLTTLNGYKRASWIYEKSSLITTTHPINLNKMDFSTNLYSLGLLTQTSESKLWNGTYHKELLVEDSNFVPEIFDTIRNGAFTYRNKKCCPLCLEESNYFRKLWELTMYNVCHKHKCKLINKCPECKGEINLNVVPIGKCRCGHYYRNSKAISIPDEDLRLENMLDARLNNRVWNNSENELSLLDIKLVIYIMILFMRYSRTIENGIISYSNKYSHKESKTAFQVFDHWPNSFYKFLDLYNSKRRTSKQGHIRLGKEFGDMYLHLLYGIKKVDNRLSFIALEFEKYLMTEWNGPLNNVLRLRGKTQEDEWLSVKKTANLIGCREERIVRLIENNIIEHKLIKSTPRHYLISRESIKSYQLKVNDEINLKDGFKILNVDYRMFNDLVKSGIIQVSNITLRKGKPKIKKSSVVSILEHFKRVANSFDGDIVSFSSAIKIFSMAKKTPSELLQLVLNGKLVPILKEPYKSQEGLKNFYFIEKQIREWIKR